MRPEIKQRIAQIQRGEVPEGYKKCSVGIRPSEWNCQRLKEICIINPPRTKTESEKTTFLGMSDVDESGHILCQNLIDTNQVKEGLTPFEKGDILVAKITPCFENGKGANTKELCTQTGVGSTEFHVLRSEINADFIFYHTISKTFRSKLEREMTGSAGQKRVQTDSLANYEIAVPCIQEQQKIAAILMTQDKIIELKEKLLAEKQHQKKYLMQQLLTGKKRLPGFSGEWKKVKLKAILRERETYSPKGLEYPHVTLSTKGILPKSERYDRDHLVKDEDKEYKITHKGDICYNPANLKFGVICENTFGNAIFSPIYVTFEVIGNVSREYLAQYLMRWDFINAIRKYEEGTVYERMAVKPEDFLKYEILLPEIKEQITISEVLSAADREIDLRQKDIEQEKQKKKALMQLLLTGIVRVKDERQ